MQIKKWNMEVTSSANGMNFIKKIIKIENKKFVFTLGVYAAILLINNLLYYTIYI